MLKLFCLIYWYLQIDIKFLICFVFGWCGIHFEFGYSSVSSEYCLECTKIHCTCNLYSFIFNHQDNVKNLATLMFIIHSYLSLLKRVLLDKLIVAQLINNFPSFCGTLEPG
jgi:hypothetical protein